MQIGITGAAGNIGTTLRQGLSKEYSLKLFDMNTINTSDGEFKKVNFAKKEEVSGIFNGLDIVIHLAGDARLNAPEKIVEVNNFLAISNVFEEAKNTSVKKIIFASSNWYHEGDIMHALNTRNSELITLDKPSTAYCPYARSKVYGEHIGKHMSFMGIQFVALRIGWTIPEDNPMLYDSPYMRAMFCSKRDLVQAFEKSINIDKNFLTAFAISNNDRRIFDLEGTRAGLGYNPVDNSEKYFK